MDLKAKTTITQTVALAITIVAVATLRSFTTPNPIATDIFVGLTTILAGLVVIQKHFITRLTSLIQQVETISNQSGETARLHSKNSDEVANLADAFNVLLGKREARTLELQNRNLQMQTLMDSAPIGILSIKLDGFIDPLFSRKATELLHTELENKNFFNILNLPKQFRDKVEIYLTSLGEGSLDDKVLLDLNPIKEISMDGNNGNRQWLRLAFYPIQSNTDSSGHFLTVIDDISEEKSLAARIAKAESENSQLKALAQDPDLFREFLIDAVQLARHAGQNSRNLESSNDKLSLLKQIMRDAHTLKGSAGTYGMFVVTDIAHQLESSLAIAIDTITNNQTSNSTNPNCEEVNNVANNKIEDNIVKTIRETTALLSHTILEISKQTNKLTGEDILEPTDLTLRVPLAKLESTICALDASIAKQIVDPEISVPMRTDIIYKLCELRSVTAKRAFAKILRVIPDLAERLGKDVRFVFEGADTMVDSIRSKEIAIPLLHILRNSLDHGIETPSERTSLCKPAQGTLTLRVATFEGTMFIEIEDDGRGLDPTRIREKAIGLGIVTPEAAMKMSKKQVYDLIFRPGFSTAANLTHSSGRGVGMDIVSVIIKEKLDGSVQIDSQIDLGTRITLRVPQPPLYSPAGPFPYPTNTPENLS